MELCPLCCHPASEIFAVDRKRHYLGCDVCGLVFVPPHLHLSPQEERAQYSLHRNDPSDMAYRRFLARLFDPLEPRLAAGAEGLDFGCGPGPTLSVMFEEKGYRMSLYDKYFAPQPHVLRHSYDFVTATEVVEHLAEPGRELARLWSLVRPGGWLGIMTKLVLSRRAFRSWHYKNDPTHISFFSERVFKWQGEKWMSPPEFRGADVILFHKPLSDPSGAGAGRW